MKVDQEGLLFSTGKRIKVFTQGVIGLDVFDVYTRSPRVDISTIHTGYDDSVLTRTMTPAEQLEIADFMICKWLEFKNKVGSQHEQNQDHG